MPHWSIAWTHLIPMLPSTGGSLKSQSTSHVLNTAPAQAIIWLIFSVAIRLLRWILRMETASYSLRGWLPSDWQSQDPLLRALFVSLQRPARPLAMIPIVKTRLTQSGWTTPSSESSRMKILSVSRHFTLWNRFSSLKVSPVRFATSCFRSTKTLDSFLLPSQRTSLF